MGFKHYWNKLKYWQKGGVIGLLISLSYIPFGLGLNLENYFFPINIISIFWNTFFIYYGKLYCYSSGGECILAAMVSSLIFIPLFVIFLGIITGSTIGFFIKIKK